MPEPLQLERIDVAALDHPDVLARLDRASRSCGLFALTNHGVGAETLSALQRQARAFFAQPHEVKRACLRSFDNPWGYNDAELTKNTQDWKEIFDHGIDGDDAHVTPWPEQTPEFRGAVLEAYAAFEALSLRLVQGFETLFDVIAGTLMRAFAPSHSSFIRLNYYRPCPDPAAPKAVAVPDAGHLGVNHHTDSGVLTVLLLDGNDGLEVFHNGAWRGIAASPGSLVVNLGDVLQVWSNDAYVAPLHRVRASADGGRLSVPFFLNPSYTASYAPLPSTVSDAAPARYRPIPWAEFRQRRLEGDYADLGSEVQISDYAVDASA